MSTLGALQYVPLSDDVRTVKSVEMAGQQHIACFVVGGEPRLDCEVRGDGGAAAHRVLRGRR